MTLKSRLPKKRTLQTCKPYDRLQAGNGLAEDLAKLAIAKTKSTPRFEGERHMSQIMPDGSVKQAEYMGPRTQIEKRVSMLLNGNTEVRPITMSDGVSMIHDIDYSLAQLSKTKEEQLARVREADLAMLKRLKKIKAKKLDTPANILLGEAGIGSKVQIEKKGKIGATLAGLTIGGPVGALVGHAIGSKAKTKMQDIAGPLVIRTPSEVSKLLKAKNGMSGALESSGVGSGLLAQMQNGKFNY